MSTKSIVVTNATFELLVDRVEAAKAASLNQEANLAAYYLEDLERILQLVDSNLRADASTHDNLTFA